MGKCSYKEDGSHKLDKNATHCRHCEKKFCSLHSIPSNHECEYLNKKDKKSKKKMSGLVGDLSSIKIEHYKEKYDKIVSNLPDFGKGKAKKKTGKKAEKKTEKKKEVSHEKHHLAMPILFLAVLLVLGAFFFYNVFFDFDPGSIGLNFDREPENVVVQTKVVVDRVPVDINNEAVIENPEKWINQRVELIGFLKHEFEGEERTGEHIYSVLDDFGNKLVLARVSSSQKELFDEQSLTEDIYKVTGTFRKRLLGLQLEVSSITRTDRPYREESRIVPVE